MALEARVADTWRTGDLHKATCLREEAVPRGIWGLAVRRCLGPGKRRAG